jgi:FMN-dependent oxidoreductase (nitrilotriacetate monooxygenase family)
MASERLLRLGTFLSVGGENMAGWRHPSVRFESRGQFSDYLDIVRMAEAAMFDLVLVADVAPSSRDPIEVLSRYAGYDRLEPLTLLSALAVTTQNIGLVATASTTYNEPYHIARKFASIDHLSKGRAGWNIVTTMTDTDALNFSRTAHASHGDRYARAEEFVDVVRGLWHCFEPGAFVRDKGSGIYFDPARLHILDHKGTNFSVRGPLDVVPSPQIEPVLVQAGSSGPGMNLGGRVADIIFSTQQTLEAGRRFCTEIRSKATAFGRNEEDLIVLMALIPVIGSTQEEAQSKFDLIQALIDPIIALPQLAGYLGGIDLSVYDLDKPLPEALPEGDGVLTTSRRGPVLALARREGLTLRQLAQRVAGTRGHRTIIGTAASVADDLEQWFCAGAADGFLLVPPVLPGSLEDFAEEVVPELQRRGLVRTAHSPGSTLRQSLGLRPRL